VGKQVHDPDGEVRALAWWRGELGQKVDISKVTLADLDRALGTLEEGVRGRIVVWKNLCTWLRRKGRLARKDDASLDLRAPKGKPKKATSTRGYPMEMVEAVYRELRSFEPEVRMCLVTACPNAATGRGMCKRHFKLWWKARLKGEDMPDAPSRRRKLEKGLSVDLAQAARDFIFLKALSGMHGSEVERMAAGDCTLREVDEGEIRGTVRFWHKTGREHTVSLDRRMLDAAKRLQRWDPKQGELYWEVRKAIHRTCQRTGLPFLNPGELRHCFTTWGRKHGRLVRPSDGGVPVEEVAAVLGHQTTRTTRMHYDMNEVPPMIVIPIDLRNDEDPQPTSTSKGLRLVESA
jgi:integrase